MSTQASGTFDLDSWDEQPYDEREGARLTRTRVTKTFHGALEGTSTAELLMAYSPVESSKAYVGFERITGTLNGRAGSFVLHHTAGAQGVSWSVVPDTGTGELHGLRGEAKITIEPDGSHTFTLDYELG